MELSALHQRIHAVAGHMTYRALAECTGNNSETIRRYMQGQSPSAEFLTALCSHFDLNAQWLILGQGPAKRAEARAHAIRQANPGELLAAIADALEKLTQRVDRIELFVQTIESRLSHARTHLAHGATDGRPAQQDHSGTKPGDIASPSSSRKRISAVASAVTQRSRADAD